MKIASQQDELVLSPRQIKTRAWDRNYRKQRTLLLNGLKNVSCKDCGTHYPPECMQFDHVRGEKRANIAHMRTCSVKKLLAEIAKCDVVCANCHAIRTHKRRKRIDYAKGE